MSIRITLSEDEVELIYVSLELAVTNLKKFSSEARTDQTPKRFAAISDRQCSKLMERLEG